MNINEKIYRNVKALCAIDGMDMKDVEAQIGRTAGYLSRKTTRVDVEMLLKLAAIFEVSADELMYKDYEHELHQKEALTALSAAIKAAKEFYNEDGILTFVENALREKEDK